MSLVITSRIISGVVIVDMSGRLCAPEVALRAHIHQQLEQGHRGFVLNLADVPYIDSFGLGQLIAIWTSIRAQGGHMVLLRPTDHVQQLLRITKLNTVFHISGEEAQALKSVRTNLAVSA